MKQITGAVIIIFGLLILLQNLGFISFSRDIWDTFWPLVIILIGIKLLYGRDEKHDCQGEKNK